MSEALRISDSFTRTVELEKRFPFVDYGSQDLEWIRESVIFIENCFPSSVLVLCKINHPAIAYVGENCEQTLGYSSQQFMKLSAEEYFNLVHPDESNAVRKLYERMEMLLKSPSYRPANWKFTFHYRLRTAQEEYIHIQDEKSAFLHSSEKLLHYSILNRVDESDAWQSPFMTIHKKANRTFKKIDTYVPGIGSRSLTTRERQILECLDAGMTTIQIAETLSLSTYTVRNHKANFFRKMYAKTSLQALNHARKWNLI